MESTYCFLLFTLWTLQLAVAKDESFSLTSHTSCCEPDQLLSENQKCVGLVYSAPISQDDIGVYKEISREPLFTCEEGSKRVHFRTEHVLNGSIIEPLIYNQTVVKENYCLHPSTQIGINAILFCRRPIQINKCCPLGQVVNRTAVHKCVAANETSPNLPVAHIVDQGYDEDWVLVQDNVSLRCDYDYNIYIPGYYSDHRFKVTNDRGLYVRKAAYAPIRQSKDYCIDSTVYANGTENVTKR